MTCNSRAQVKGTSSNQKGTRHKWGTSSKIQLCPHKSLFFFYLIAKGHKGTKKEVGIREMGKTVKNAQKWAKRGENKKHQRSRKNLCLVPFPLSGALA